MRLSCARMAVSVSLSAVLAGGCGTIERAVRASPTPGTSAHPLAIGQPHAFDWGGRGSKVEITPLTLQQGRIADLSDYKLKTAERRMIPFYVRLRVRNVGRTPLEEQDFGGSLHVQLQDPRGRTLTPVSLFDVFGDAETPCDTRESPANWPPGASLESCSIFLAATAVRPSRMSYSVGAGLVDARSLVWWQLA